MVLLSTAVVLLTFVTFSLQFPLAKRSISAGPVISSNFPDPSFVYSGTIWYAYSTNSDGKHVPIAASPDFVTWTVTGQDALPVVGEWSTGDQVWAPDVVQLADGSFVLYYSAISKTGGGHHCVGAATSPTAGGPYAPGPQPIACPIDQGGAIDPAGFKDFDGRQYLVYKIDGNSIGQGGNCNNGVAPLVDTFLMLQEMESDGVTPTASPPVKILNRDDADGPLVEAPSLVRVPSAASKGGWMYILFFSSNCFNGPLYDISYATSLNGITNGGKLYEKASAPLLVTGSDGGKFFSPGGLDVGPYGHHVTFHADLGTDAQTRQMWTGILTISGRVVSIL